jgi:hypothetical protein
MEYHEVAPITREQAEAALASKDPSKIVHALLSVTYHDLDWRWVQAICLRFIQDEDATIRGPAVTCIGHLVRIHGVLDEEVVLPVLVRLTKDTDIGGRAYDVLDDVHMFLRRASRE